MILNVCGQDPSLLNWGVSNGTYDTETKKLTINNILVINPVLSKGKQVRQNSLDLEAAKQLCEGAMQASKQAQVIFVEVPVGSQSARSMAGYGVVVGVLGSLRAMGIPLFEVSPQEVKLAGAGKATATKIDMINWAIQTHPEAKWPTYRQKGKELINTGKAEHQADSVAAIYAGIASNTFQQMLPMWQTKGIYFADSS